MKLLSSDQLDRIDRHLRLSLARTLSPGELRGMNAMVGDYVLAGGKRVRPQLAVWVFDHATDGEEASDGLLDVACAWELFHAFLLIHDDIIDASATRRDRPALHRQLAELDHGSPKFGRDLAIVAGDLLFGAAMRLCHEADFPHAIYREALQLFSRIACTTGFGQAIDIVQTHAPLASLCERKLLLEYQWKTAAYTFEGPMLTGAIVAGVSDAARAAISQYALALGAAYQIHNDLLDLRANLHEGSDLVQGKHTVALFRARLGMDSSTRSRFDSRFDELRTANGHTMALATELREMIFASGAIEETQAAIDESLNAAAEAADSADLPPRLSVAMANLLASLGSSYFAKA